MPTIRYSFKTRTMSPRQRGFTLVELVMVIVLVGILSVYVAPRFFEANAFKERGFADQLQATVRYAQKVAVAQRRQVCVAIASPTPSSATVALTIGAAFGAACTLPLNVPGQNSNVVQSGSVGATAATFSFDAQGRPSAAQAITVANYVVTVEAETGYVHQ